MTTQTPRNLPDLLAELDKLADLHNRAICRGQAEEERRLEPFLDRGVGSDVAYRDRLDEERGLVEQFSSGAEHLLGETEWKLVSQGAPKDLIRPMTVMQHYGAPTRLLDWTASPFVAAFFAAVDTLEKDGAVWWYRYERLQDAAKSQWQRLDMDREPFDYNPFAFREDSPDFIGPVHLIIPFARAEAQQGLFTVAGRLGSRHDKLLADLLRPEDWGKLIIQSRLKRELLKALGVRGVTASSLQHVGADRLGFQMSRERRG